MTFSDSDNDGHVTAADIKQINHYYPFGLNMEGNWNGAQGNNKYQYNEKEWNDDFGLGWNDYGARFYDPSVARWWNVDPLSEKYFNTSPYSYVVNNPMLFIDPDGRTIIVRIQGEDGSNIDLQYRDNKLYNGDNEYDGKNEFALDALKALNTMTAESQTAADINKKLSDSGNQFVIQYGAVSGHDAPDLEAMKNEKGTAYITWNNKGNESVPTIGSPDGTVNQTMVLGHELYGHGSDANDGKMDYSTVGGTPLPKTEEYATYIENKIRKDMSLPLRTHYDVAPPTGLPLDSYTKYHVKILNSNNTARRFENKELYKKTIKK